MELYGVGSHRADLIDTIFDKYRKRCQKYADLLSSEFFLQQLDAAQDELVSLSYNPLFLTVMSYVYITKVIAADSPMVEWGASVKDLVMECVNLLLYDLDETKTINFPPAYRAAILNRRNRFKDEKLAFLRSFALTTIIDGLPVFGRTHMTQYAQRFFQVHADWPNSAAILREMNRGSFARLTIVDDLIFCGLFLIVDKGPDGPVFDFPIRRFREILAVEHLECQSHVRSILSVLVARGDLNETLYVAFELSRLQREIIEAILAEVGRSDDSRLDLVLRTCLSRRPPGYNPTAPLQQWLLKCVRDETKFVLSDVILEQLTPDDEFVASLQDEFCSSISRGAFNHCGFALLM